MGFFALAFFQEELNRRIYREVLWVCGHGWGDKGIVRLQAWWRRIVRLQA